MKNQSDFAGRKGNISHDRATKANIPYQGQGLFDTSNWRHPTGPAKGPQRGHSSRTKSNHDPSRFFGGSSKTRSFDELKGLFVGSRGKMK